MADVPEFQGFTQGDSPAPVPFQQTAPASAQPFAVAQGIDEFTAHVGKIAQDEFERASSERAMRGVNDFQQTLIKARDSYGALRGDDAMKEYPRTIERLNQQRQALYEGMGRKAGDLFMNGSHGDYRIEVSNLEAHHTQELRGLALSTAKGQIQGDSRVFAATVLSPSATPATIDAAWGHIVKKTTDSAFLLKLSGTQASEFVDQQLAIPATAALRAAATPGSKADLKGLIEKYGEYAKPEVVAGAEKALNQRVITTTADNIVQSSPRLNELGVTDPTNGVPSQSAINAQLKQLRNDPNFDAIVSQVNSVMKLEEGRRSGAAGELYHKIVGANTATDGIDLAKVSAMDMDDLKALDSGLHLNLIKASMQTQDKRSARDKRMTSAANDANLKHLEADLSADPDETAKLNPNTLLQKMKGYDGGFTPAGTSKAVSMLKALQGQHKADNLNWVTSAVRGMVGQWFKPDDMKPERLGSNPTYQHLISAANKAVQAGTLKRSDPGEVLNFVNEEMKLTGGSWGFGRRHQVDVDYDYEHAPEPEPAIVPIVSKGVDTRGGK